MARRPHKKRKSKRRKPRYWPSSIAWMRPGVLAQFRAHHRPQSSNDWVIDWGIGALKDLKNFSIFSISDRRWLQIYNELCMIVDKRRFSDNVVAVQVIHKDKIFWVLWEELCKLKDRQK